MFVQFLFVFTVVDHSPITLGKYIYPQWADGIGWLMFAIVVAMIPLIAIIEIIRARRAHPFLSISVSAHRYRSSPSRHLRERFIRVWCRSEESK